MRHVLKDLQRLETELNSHEMLLTCFINGLGCRGYSTDCAVTELKAEVAKLSDSRMRSVRVCAPEPVLQAAQPAGEDEGVARLFFVRTLLSSSCL